MRVNADFTNRSWTIDNACLDYFLPVSTSWTPHQLLCSPNKIDDNLYAINDDFLPSSGPQADNYDTIPGTTLFCGSVIRHFGHQMIENVHRLWAIRHTPHDHLLFHYDEVIYPSMLAVVTDAVTMMGGDTSKLLVSKDNLKFEKLIIPERGVTIDSPVANDNYLKELLSPADNPTLKLFVTRRRLRGMGMIAGESYIARLLGEMGYEDFVPEDHSLAEQAEKYRNASHIIFVDGSAVYGFDLIGVHPNCRVGVISRRHYNIADVFKTKVGYLSITSTRPYVKSVRAAIGKSLIGKIAPATTIAFVYPHNFFNWLSELCGHPLQFSMSELRHWEGEDTVEYMKWRIKDRQILKVNIQEIALLIESVSHRVELLRMATDYVGD